MPIIKSAKKRVRIARRAAVRNSKTKRSLRSALKAFNMSISGTNKKNVLALQSKAQSALDKATKKGVMHKNKVDRKKRQLAAKTKAAGITISKTPTVSSVRAVKKTTRKRVAKKPTAIKKTTKK